MAKGRGNLYKEMGGAEKMKNMIYEKARNDFEKGYDMKVYDKAIAAVEKKRMKKQKKSQGPINLKAIVTVIVTFSLVASSLLLSIFKGHGLAAWFLISLFADLILLIRMSVDKHKKYNSKFMREFAKRRIPLFKKYLSEQGYDTPESRRSLYNDYRFEHLESQMDISGRGETVVLFCGAVLSSAPLVASIPPLTEGNSQSIFCFRIAMALVEIPLIVYAFRKILNVFYWPDTKGFILTDLKEIVGEDLDAAKGKKKSV